MSDDIGLIAGHVPSADDAPEAAMNALAGARPEQRDAALRRLARALLARGSAQAYALLKLRDDVEANGAAPTPAGDDDRAIRLTMADFGLQFGLKEEWFTRGQRDPRRAAVLTYNLGSALALRGDFARAATLQQAALTTLSAVLPAHDERLSAMRVGLARTHLLRGDAEAVDRLVELALTAEYRAGRQTGLVAADALTVRAALLNQRGRYADAAATLTGAIALADAEWERRGTPRMPPGAIIAMAARIGDAGWAALGFKPGDAAALDKEMAAPEVDLRKWVEGSRYLLLTRIHLNLKDAAAAKAALSNAGNRPERQMLAVLVSLGEGMISGGALQAELWLDIVAAMSGIENPDVIQGRTALGVTWVEVDPAVGWAYIRQAARGAIKRLREGQDGTEAANVSRAYRETLARQVSIAWRAAHTPQFDWPPAQSRFSVYFDIGEFSITPNADVVLTQVAARAARKAGRIRLTSTYFVGRPQVADPRAAVASLTRDRLIALGVASDRIDISYSDERPKPERAAIFGTVTQARRNRRVDIELLPMAVRGYRLNRTPSGTSSQSPASIRAPAEVPPPDAGARASPVPKPAAGPPPPQRSQSARVPSPD